MRTLLQFTLDLFSDPLPAPQKEALVGANFQHPSANREVLLGQSRVAYEFKRGKRRTIGFSVGPQGLVVSAPKWVTLAEVDNALREKTDWIVKKLLQSRERNALLESNCLEWKDGVCLPFMGEPLVVLLDLDSADPRVGRKVVSAELQRNAGLSLNLKLGLPPSAGEQQIRDAVQGWLQRQAHSLFTERLNHFAPQLQVQWRRLTLSNAGTRWGSAHSDGSIRLHWRLIHFKPEVIDYVVAHELSHLRVMNHSPRFWATVGSVVPDYALLRSQLKDESLPRWQ